MSNKSVAPVVKPTDIEKLLWSRVRLKKAGGLVARAGNASPRALPPCSYGPRDKTDLDHWDCKMRGGPDAEWWAYMLEGASRVIDIGCGYGFPSFYLASRGFEVVGVDPSPSEIATAEKYRLEEGPDLRLSYVLTDQDNLPFPDDSFDGAAFSGSIACAYDPERLAREAIRVLKPGSRVAFDEEDRALESRSHPVVEHTGIIYVEHSPHLWVESRICEPYLDRRYLIRLSNRFEPRGPLTEQRVAGTVAPAVSLKDAGLSIEEVLEHAVEGEYGEAVGYDPFTLREFVESMGFRDLKYWARNNGRKFAKELAAAGVLEDMPDDIPAVLRALVRSIPPLSSPTTLVSCISP